MKQGLEIRGIFDYKLDTEVVGVFALGFSEQPGPLLAVCALIHSNLKNRFSSQLFSFQLESAIDSNHTGILYLNTGYCQVVGGDV